MDISYVQYWTPTTTVLAILWGVAVVTLLTLVITANVRKWGGRYDRDGVRFGLGAAFVVTTFLVSIFVFGAWGAGNYAKRAEDAKVAELTKLGYREITLTEDKFTASMEGKYVKALLEKQPNGKFEILEMQAAK